MNEQNEAEILAAETGGETAPAYCDEQDVSVTDAWSVQHLSDADWALSRLSELERELAENEELESMAIARIKARSQILSERIKKGMEFFRGRLASYAYANREQLLGGGKKKSRSLMHGTLGFRKAGGGLEVYDEDALLEWCRMQPVEKEFVRIIEHPAIAKVKEHFKKCGELPQGCALQPDREEVVIKTVDIGHAMESTDGSN